MDKKFFLIDEDFFSDETHKNNFDSNSKTNSFQYSNQENLSKNSTANYICQNIILNVTK